MLNRTDALKTASALFFKIFSAASTIVLTFVITQSTNEFDAGKLFFYIAIISFFGSVATLGSPILIIRNVSKYYHDNKWSLINNDISLLIYVLLVASISTILLVTLLFGVLNPQSVLTYALLVVGVFLFASVQCVSAAFQSVGRTTLSIAIQNALIPLLFILTVTIYRYFQVLGHSELLLIYLLAILFVSGVGLTQWFSYSSAALVSRPIMRQENKDSIMSVIFITLMIQLAQWSSQLTVGALMPPEELALFSVAQRISIAASFIMVAVNLIVVPKLSVAYSRNNLQGLNKLIKNACQINLALGVPLVLFICIFSQEILSIFGSQYSAGAPLLLILTLGQFVNLFTGPVADLLYMTKNEVAMRNILFISGLFSVLASFVLTLAYGIQGAACATATTICLQNLLAAHAVKRKCGFNPLNLMRKT